MSISSPPDDERSGFCALQHHAEGRYDQMDDKNKEIAHCRLIVANERCMTRL